MSIDRRSTPARQDASPIRVLIVDDSVVARAVLMRILAERDDFIVVAQSSSIAAALKTLDEKNVDVILLDLHMPGVDGIAALPELIARGRGARILVVSSACTDGAAATLEVMGLGAAGTLLKPDPVAISSRFGDELVGRLRRIARPARGSAPDPDIVLPPPLECVAIGASTGGVPALRAFFDALPRAFDVPILVTQHLPAPFIPFFADQLTAMTGRRTRVAAPGHMPLRGELLLAPGDAHLTLVRTGQVVHVRLERSRVPSGCMPSVDPMLASVGRLYGAAALGVVLSGMGKDGAQGARALVHAGGLVMAQDAASSVVWGMPGVVAEAGLARAVAPPAELARLVVARMDESNAWK